MSEALTTKIARRPVVAALLAVVGVGAAGGALYSLSAAFGRHYPRTKFDDLLNQLDDRESAVKIGTAVMAAEPHFDADTQARTLRDQIGKGTLKDAVEIDLARGHLTAIRGWLLPSSLTVACAIAAKVQPGS